MEQAAAVGWLSGVGLVVLMLYGAFFMMVGIMGCMFPFVLASRGPVDIWRYVLAGPVVGLVGAGTLMRLRMPAALLSVPLAVAGAHDIYFSSTPWRLEALEIVFCWIAPFLPLVLTVLLWQRLRWVSGSSRLALGSSIANRT